MHKGLFNCAAVLSFVASAGVAVAQTPAQPCLTPEEMRGLAGFLLPSALDTTIDTCGEHLAPTGYLATRGDALVAKVTAGQDADWPMAKAAVVKLFASRQPAMADLPDDMLRPIVEIGISTELAARIGPEQCREVERFAEPLDPLPRANLVSLFALAIPMIGQPERRIRACPAG